MNATSYDTAERPLVRRLNEIARSSPHLARITRLYASTLPLLDETEPVATPDLLSPVAAREKLERGQFLLQDLEIELDIPAVTGLLLRLAAAAGNAGENVVADKVRMWLATHEDVLGEVFQDVLQGRGRMIADAAETMGMDAELCRALAQNALKPHLRAWGRKLAPLAAGIPWNKSTCFVCGALPVVGELQGNGQALHLRCGLCGSDWEYQRLACVHCGNEDHRSREYLFPEGQYETEHIEACTSCNSYLKVIAAFFPTTAELLPAEDLATVHLDAAARARGYWRIGNFM